MAHRKIDEVELLDRLLDAFRRYGWEGASISRLSAATGLERASLYHRYPGGKRDMAVAAAARAAERFADDVLAPLHTSAAPAERVRLTAERLDEFFDGGTSWCLCDTLTLAVDDDRIAAAVRGNTENWLAAFRTVAHEAGHEDAEQRARRALVAIQGSLVLARATGDRTAFRDSLASLPELLAR